MQKFKEYMNFLKSNNRAFLPDLLKTVPLFEEYWSNQAIIDTKVKLDYANLTMVDDVTSADDSTIDDIIMATYFTNKYKWEGLKESTEFKYNPIWNVEGTETTTDTYAEIVKNNTIGETKEKVTSGSRTDSSKDSIYPFNNEELTETGQNESTKGQQIDEKTTNPHTDTEVTNARTDTHVLERGGNIGVTKTTELIQSQREILDFSWLWEIMKDIIDAITIPYFGENDCNFNYSEGGEGTDLTEIKKEISEIKVKNTLQDSQIEEVNKLASTNALDIQTVEGNMARLEESQTNLRNDMNNGFIRADLSIDKVNEKVPFSFGTDAEGNYGYYKEGIFVPFDEGGEIPPMIGAINFGTGTGTNVSRVIMKLDNREKLTLTPLRWSNTGANYGIMFSFYENYKSLPTFSYSNNRTRANDPELGNLILENSMLSTDYPVNSAMEINVPSGVDCVILIPLLANSTAVVNHAIKWEVV